MTRTSSHGRVHGTAVRVAFGDTDMMRVAYYANYLRWFELGRNEYMRAAGMPHSRLESQGIVLPVTQVTCRYRRPARYDDLLEIDTSLRERSRVRLRFHYRIRRAGEAEPLAEGDTLHACVTAAGFPRRLPQALLECLDRFEAALT